MFSLLKLVVFALGSLVLIYFVLGYLGYDINLEYFKESKASCEKRLKECSNNLVRQGLDNAKCDYNCVDRNIIIKKK